MSEPAGGFYYLPASMLAWKVTKSRPNLWIRSSNHLAETRASNSLKGNSFNLYTALKEIIIQWPPPISSWVGWPLIKWFIYFVFRFLIIILIGNMVSENTPWCVLRLCFVLLGPTNTSQPSFDCFAPFWFSWYGLLCAHNVHSMQMVCECQFRLKHLILI